MRCASPPLKRRRQPIQRQVFEPHRVQKTQPLPHLFRIGPAISSCIGESFERVEKLLRLRNGQRRRLAIFFPVADAHRPRLGPQPLPAAIRALRVAAILAQHHAHVQLVLLALHLRKEAHHARKSIFAAQHRLACRFRHLAPRHVQRHAQFRRALAQFVNHGRYLGRFHGSIAPPVKRQSRVGNHQVQVEVHGVAESLAARARAKGIVEAEQPRLRLAPRPMAAWCTHRRRRKTRSRLRSAVSSRGASSKITSPASRYAVSTASTMRAGDFPR
jgi:hypothetical protein